MSFYLDLFKIIKNQQLNFCKIEFCNKKKRLKFNLRRFKNILLILILINQDDEL